MSPRTKQTYKLIPESVPERARSRSGIYDRIVADFLARKETSVRVQVDGRKPASVRLSLKKALERSGAKAAVVARGDMTYLVKK